MRDGVISRLLRYDLFWAARGPKRRMAPRSHRRSHSRRSDGFSFSFWAPRPRATSFETRMREGFFLTNTLDSPEILHLPRNIDRTAAGPSDLIKVDPFPLPGRPPLPDKPPPAAGHAEDHSPLCASEREIGCGSRERHPRSVSNAPTRYTRLKQQ